MTICIGINGFGRIGRNIFRAASAVSLVIPQLKGKFDGLAVRVPTPTSIPGGRGYGSGKRDIS